MKKPAFKIRGAWLLPLLAVAVAAQVQTSRPGIDRPIRVAMFRGTGPGSFWHTNMHTSHTVMASLLADPAAANLGDSLIVPSAGFAFRTVPTAAGTGGPDSTCGGQSGCRPDSAALSSWVTYVRDSADVMILGSSTNFGGIVTETAQRRILADHWTTKGYIAIHGITDSKGTWGPLDTIHGTQFNNHPPEQIAQVRRDSVHQNEAAWQYLNKGMFSNGTDSSFIEEWHFFTSSGAQIRARAFVKPTVKLVETTLTGISSFAMGDHPLSWYRQLPTGGRVLHTALGHRSQTWQGTRAFRRQIYNAILWASKYDSLSTVSIASSRKDVRAARDSFRLSSSRASITVTVVPAGAHTVELVGLDGSRIAGRKGEGAGKAHDFTGLRSGVYAVSVTTSEGRSRSLVAVE